MRSGRGKNKTERGRETGNGRDYREKRNSSDVYTTHSPREDCILTEGKHIGKKIHIETFLCSYASDYPLVTCMCT